MRRPAAPAALLCVCFCAGIIGIFAAMAGEWLWARAGLPGLGGWALQPIPAVDGFYARLFYGGVWGLLFFIGVGAERGRKQWIRKGLLLGLVPALIQLLLLFPGMSSVSLEAGILRPLLLLLLNLAWGATVGIVTRLFWGRG